MQTIFNEMVTRDDEQADAESIAKELNLIQVSDESFLDDLVDQVLADHADEVQRYRDGKKGLFGFFIGQTMQRSQGKANPQVVKSLLQEKLEE
jgi:Asp-tRNA(Asn)/Glu-tRNA(Gln) amidotransferase B subunit